MLNPVTVSPVNSGFKNFIFGKMWLNSQDGNRAGSIKVSRALPTDLIIKPETTIFLVANKKREGFNDADYSVSVLLPTAVADELIEAEKVNATRINAELADTAQADVSIPA